MTEKQRVNWQDYNGDDRVISAHEMTLTLDRRQDSIFKVKSLFPSLDRAIEHFEAGELIVVSGPTKNGKSLFCQSLTQNFSRQGQPSLWFSYELTPRGFLAAFPEIPLLYMPMKLRGHDLGWMSDRVSESFEKYRTRIVFIDHLHYCLDMARTRNPSIEIGQVIRRLKSMSVEKEIVVFLLCHTKMGKHDSTLSYESIRDSSFVSQESDTVFMIQRKPDLGENRARLRVEFHRRTGVLERTVDLIKIDGLLRECAQQERPPQRERADFQ